MKKLILVIAFLLFSMNVYAEMITFRATGNITHVDDGLDTGILVGDLFTLDLMFSSTLTDVHWNTDDHSRGRYLGEHMSLEIGTFQAETFERPNFGPNINVQNLPANLDRYTWHSGKVPNQAPLQGDRELIAMAAEFTDYQGTIFDSDALPLLPPDLNEFETSTLSLVFSNDYSAAGAAFDSRWIYGDITQLALAPDGDGAPIPEPTTIALLGIGLVGLAGAEVRRRRKKKAVDNS